MLDSNLYSQVREKLVTEPSEISDLRIQSELHAARVVTDLESIQELRNKLQIELEGLGLLSELFQPGVTDVLVNGPNEIWIDGLAGLQQTDLRFDSNQTLNQFAIRIAAALGTRLDTSQPLADATFSNGIRFSAILPPLVSASAVLAFRIPNSSKLGLDVWDSAAISAAQLLELVINRFTLVVSGATGAGKTTLLKSLLSNVPPNERVITIEDQIELAQISRHQISLQSRSANYEGIGEVDVTRLLRQSLRLRPDRIMVGELRGVEVLVWLQAINTGHPGSFTSIHANSAQHAVGRLEFLAQLAGLKSEVANALITDSVDLIIHCERLNGIRHIAEVLAVSDRAKEWM